MRHFATLALAATLLTPAALAQTTGLSVGPTVERPVTASAPYKSSAAITITQNSSLDVTTSAVACRSSATDDESGERIFLGTTNNSFYRVFDLGKFTLPDNPELTSVDAGVTVEIYEEGTRPATGRLTAHTLPAGTNVESGFAVSALSELATATLTFETDTLALVNVGFDDPANPFDGAPALNGDELLVIEVFFSDGSQNDDEGTPRQYDAAAAGNRADASGASYLGTDDCGGITPTPFGDVGDGFDMEVVMVLNINTVGEGGGAVTVGEGRDAGVGETVTVAGTVTRAGGAFVYVQDETGGLAIRQTSGDFFDGVADGSIAPGTTVEITGTLSEFNGLLQINNEDLTEFTITGTADVPDAQTVTLAEIAADGEDFEGELVTVTGVTLGTTTDTEFQARTTYDITDASDMTGAVTLRLPNADDGTADGTSIPSGPFSITGVVSQFDNDDPRDSGYQILLISADDVMSGSVAIGEDPEGRLSLGAVAPNPSASWASVAVTLQEAGHATVAVYDLLGREVATVLDRALTAGTSSLDLEVGALPAGTYMVRLSAGGATVVRPFTVAR